MRELNQFRNREIDYQSDTQKLGASPTVSDEDQNDEASDYSDQERAESSNKVPFAEVRLD